MVCSLLESAMKEPPLHVEQAWEDERNHVPIPNGYRLVWVRSDWLPYTNGFRTENPVHVARLLGRAAASKIWAAVHEDSVVARQALFQPETGLAVPVLVKENERRKLSGYPCTGEEAKTTEYIHRSNGFREDENGWIKVFISGEELSFRQLPSSLLEMCRSMSLEDRRTSIPRIGIVDPAKWEALGKTGLPPLGVHVKTIPTDDGMLAYFASIRDCVSLYGLSGKEGLCRDYPEMRGIVGHDFGSLIDPKAAAEVPLWERVFGDDLVRFAAQDESIASNDQ